ncbi:MAG: polyphosphate polymerase domain-containing protein [Lachnospiraceae bacterium]|nr:polyphosphate polymerase domain-containing protein [Lachnospiraceae bacterium]
MGEKKEKHYRHEWKHEITYADLIAIRMRMSRIAIPDPHAKDGKYLIRSLYFDNAKDKALREKIDGVNRREKFRIRYYNLDPSIIHLEKKSKVNGLGTKYNADLTADEAQRIVDGDTDWMLGSGRPLVEELYCKMRYQGMRPVTIVDYTREPFIFGPGNVRVTLDYDIRTGLKSTDFLNPECVTIPAGDAPIILEVKWDAFLPDIIRDAVQLKGCRVGAFSKYGQCRIYG